MPGFGYIHRLKVKECYPGVPSDVAEMLSHPIEGEVQDINRITEQEIIKIEQKHALVPRRWVNIRPEKKTVILHIDPDSNSDIVIEEEEGDFRERYIITKGNEWNVEEEAEQADDEWSEPFTTAETEPGMSLTTEQETEDKDETISSTSTQDFNREKLEREFINLASSLSTDRREFQEIGRRGSTYEKATTSNQSCKDAYTTYDQNWGKSIIHVWTMLWRRTKPSTGRMWSKSIWIECGGETTEHY